MLLKIYPQNPDEKRLNTVVECLKDGGIVIYPTDSVYGLGCDLFNSKAVERVAKLKDIKPEKANFSIICYDLSHISDFTRPFDNTTFKLLKKALPGPFTFILNGNNSLTKIFKGNKKTIGIRVPDNAIPREIVRLLGNPIITSSIHDEDDVIEYTTDPELIYEKYKTTVDIVIDGGFGNNEASTIVDCTGDSPQIMRQGIGIIEGYVNSIVC